MSVNASTGDLYRQLSDAIEIWASAPKSLGSLMDEIWPIVAAGVSAARLESAKQIAEAIEVALRVKDTLGSWDDGYVAGLEQAVALAWQALNGGNESGDDR